MPTNILATTWFENDHGKFIAHDLHSAAQVSHTHGILAKDFNSDGRNMDILLVGNDGGFEVQTGSLETSPVCLLLGIAKEVLRVPPLFLIFGQERKLGMWFR